MLTGKLYYGSTLISDPDAGGESGGWERHPDWLAMPSSTAGEEVIYALAAVGDWEGNHFAVTIAGDYSIDWGDGSAVENVSSGVKAEHDYDYSDLDALTEFSAALTGDTMRQALVTITPQTGADDLTSINFNVKSSAATATDITAWLDIAISAPNCTSLVVGGTTGKLYVLERAEVREIGALTNASAMFYQCYSLQSVPLFDLSAVENTSYMFWQCYALHGVPLFDLSAVENASYMFWQCYALHGVPLFDLSAVENTSYMFYQCYALHGVPLFDLSAVENTSAMLYQCYALQSVPSFDLSALMNASFMFYQCLSLKRSKVAGLTVEHSYANTALSRSAIVEVFTNLGTAVGAQTITVTGTPGAAALDAGDLAVATGKGWTVAA